MSLKVRERIDNLLVLADELQQEADKHNITHVFDDGGYRELLLLRMFGLTKLPGRHGDDGIDSETGYQYELKTVNLINTKGLRRRNPGITTCHHVNAEVIERYRKVRGFLIGVFHINTPARIYEVPTEHLELYFRAWEMRLLTERGLTHINNPKIKFGDVLKYGILHYHDNRFDEFFGDNPGHGQLNMDTLI